MNESLFGEIVAVVEHVEGRVEVRFPVSVNSLRLTPKTARGLADLLYDFANEAEGKTDGTGDPPGPGDQPAER